MRDDIPDGDECRSCGAWLSLNDGCEWPEAGPVCYSCLCGERTALLAACKEATEFASWAEGQIRGLTQSLGSHYDRPPEIAEALAVLSAAVGKAEKGGQHV